MKKITILSLCLFAGMSAMAQKDVVKEADRAMKAGKPFSEVVTIITPAFSDPTTKESAETYYIPGKAGFKQYDSMLGKRAMGQLDENGPLEMAKALMGGYEHFMKALPLDSLPDAKGKVKPKYSKDIYNVIGGHLNDFSNAAVDFWNVKDYGKAYDAWGIYLDLARDPRFTKVLPGETAPADSTMSDISYNRALAAWQADNFENAIDAFRLAIKLGYSKKSVYDYGVAVAIGGKNNEALLEFATAGNEKFGNEDATFLNQIINYYLQTEKYTEALDYLNKGIAEKPNSAQYYALRGIIYDNQKEAEKAQADYEKAIQLDANHPLALFYMGRNVAMKAGALQDAYDKNDFDQYKKDNIDPLYKQAADYLEKAYTVDEGNREEVLKLLEVIYYNLNDAEKMKSVEDRKINNE